MPEGHTIHRLAAALSELYGGQRLHASSPQGRFTAGAEHLDGQVMLGAQAHGKHLFVPFGPQADLHLDDEAVTWLRIHLGLYGSWTFDGDSEFTAPHAIGAPRRRVGERGEHALAHGRGPALSGLRGEDPEPQSVPQAGSASPTGQGGRTRSADSAGSAGHLGPGGVSGAAAATGPACPAAPGEPATPAPRTWQPPEPRGAVRLRLQGEHGVADLTGPAACELLDAEGVAAVRRRLGPDPLRPDGQVQAFVCAARRRRKAVGELLMDQAVLAGAGNIYRAETLFRTGTSPFRPGNRISEQRLRAIWEDLRPLMEDGVATGLITTVDEADAPEPLPPGDQEAGRWYVYHRTGRPCLRCGTPIAEKTVAGRRLFWCPRCQAR